MTLKVLNKIYASALANPLLILKIENEAVGSIRLALSESDTEIDGLTYSASAFSVELPERSDNGFSDLTFTADNVGGTAYAYIKKYLDSGTREPVYVTLSQYEPGTKEELSSLKLTLTGAIVTSESAQFTASFCDMLNCEFPKLRYTSYNTPGLAYA